MKWKRAAAAAGALVVIAVGWFAWPSGPPDAPAAGETRAVRRHKPFSFADLGRLARPARPVLGKLSGRVTGEGKAEASVSVVGPGGQSLIRADAQGRFEVGELLPGDYALSASHGDQASEVLGPVPLGAGEEIGDLVLQLVPGGSLAGRVVDALNRAPIKDASLSAGGAVAVSLEDGSFDLRGIPPGEIGLTLSHKGFVTSNTRLAIASGKRQTGLELTLTPAAHVAGKVVRVDGAPIASALVMAQRYGFGRKESPSEVGSTDADGHFDGFLESGRYALFAAIPEGEARTDDVELGPREERTNLVLTADLGGGIVGQVLEADGSPAVGASVTAVETVTQRVMASRSTVEDARFQFDGLPSGVYAVVAHQGARTAQRSGVRLEGGDVATAQVQFGEGAISGTVVDAAGQPVVGAQVSAAPEGSIDYAASAAEADARGAFHFEGLSGTRFTLKAQHPSGSAEVHGVAAGEKAAVLRIVGQGELQGYVADEEGQAVSDFTVLAEPLDPSRQGGSRTLGHFASPTGDFHLKAAPGRYSVRVSSAGYVTGEGGQAEAPRNGSSPDIRVVLRRTRSIAGDVLDANDRHPIAGAKVATNPGLLFAFARTSPVHSGGFAVTDGSGHFVITDAEPGDVNVFANAEGYRGTGSGHASSGQDVSNPVTILLAPGDNGTHDFAGIGMQVGPGFTVAFVFDGGPADVAGIRAGDQIVAVDGNVVAGTSLMTAINWIRGEVGTPVVLSLTRNGDPLTLTAVRADIKF